MRFLLDVNVLIALAIPEHPHYLRVHAWQRKEAHRLWASCALTQSGFLRAVSRNFGSTHHSIAQALAALEQNCQSPEHEFWPVDVDLRELSASYRSRLIGANQIADMQLIMLAHMRNGQLATLDSGLREMVRGTPYNDSLTCI